MSDRDYLQLDGAQSLARRIHRYWAEKGYEVLAWAEKVPDHKQILKRGETLFQVRSDLINGMPIRRSAKAAA